MQVAEADTLRSGRLVLRPLRFEHIHKYFKWNNDRDLNHLDDEVGHVKESFGDFKVRFERMIHQPSPRDQYFEMSTHDDELIGVAYSVGISPYNKYCLVGVTIGERSKWAQGFGKEALQLLLAYCFEDLGMHRVTAETYEYNPAWDRLVRSIGFKLEGVRREHLLRDGKYHDRFDFGLLEDEYRAL
jgi:RimJ/RimL family protein N-acetyltransferase